MIDDSLIAEAIAAYREHGSRDGAARALGIDPKTIRRRLSRASELGMLGIDPVMPGFRISRVSNTPSGTFIQQRPELSDEPFEVPAGHAIKGVSALVDPDGRILQQWIKTRQDGSNELREAILAEFGSLRGKSELIDSPAGTAADLLTLYPIADQHNGMLAWWRDAGASWDIKISSATLTDAAGKLFRMTPRSQTAIILNLGDWQHTDDSKNMTPKGHNILDVDSRYPKILKAGVRLMREIIYLALEKHEKVIVRNISGNHDPHASQALTLALSMYFENNERVTIDDDPSDFFYHHFGRNLIGAAHGDKLKPADMAMTMAMDRPKAWSETFYRRFYYGDKHHVAACEVGNVVVECIPSLACRDNWGHGKGFRSGQTLTAITFHKERGPDERVFANIVPPYAEYEKVAA